MKKLVLLLLTLAMAFSFAVADEASPAGSWYLNTVIYKDFPVPAYAFGMDMTLALNNDGTSATALTGYATLEGTWSMKNNLVTVASEGVSDQYTYDIADDTLTADSSEGMSLVFGRNPAEKVVYGQSPIDYAVSAEDFYGSWFCIAVQAGEVQTHPILANMTLAMSIDAYEAACVHLIGETNIGWVGGVGEIVNGEMPIDVISELEPLELKLHIDQDGILSYTDGDEGALVTYYFQRGGMQVVD